LHLNQKFHFILFAQNNSRAKKKKRERKEEEEEEAKTTQGKEHATNPGRGETRQEGNDRALKGSSQRPGHTASISLHSHLT
jgi:hypothetical protein